MVEGVVDEGFEEASGSSLLSASPLIVAVAVSAVTDLDLDRDRIGM